MAILVIGCALLGVREHLVGLFGLFEFLFSGFGGIALIAVRVVLHRQFAIGLFDLFFRGGLSERPEFRNSRVWPCVSFAWLQQKSRVEPRLAFNAASLCCASVPSVSLSSLL